MSNETGERLKYFRTREKINKDGESKRVDVTRLLGSKNLTKDGTTHNESTIGSNPVIINRDLNGSLNILERGIREFYGAVIPYHLMREKKDEKDENNKKTKSKAKSKAKLKSVNKRHR